MTREEIEAALQKKACEPCSRCSHMKFSIVGTGEIDLDKKDEVTRRVVPTAVVACSNCGNITLYSTVILKEVIA